MNYKSKSSIIEINQSWHIPRASLGSGSSSNNSSVSRSANGSQLSHSNASSLIYGKQRSAAGSQGGGRRTQRSHIADGSHRNRAYLSDGDDEPAERAAHRRKRQTGGRRGHRSNSSDSHYATAGAIGSHPNGGLQAAADFVVASASGVKRTSQSSQGSTDSNHSSHSASSGSMLLTAANLEQLAQIHKRNELNSVSGAMLQANVDRLTSTYSANITSAAETAASPSTIIAIHGGANGPRPKDADTLSLASSTHFTMVNGVGGPQRKHKSGLCDRGHQITVLILTMSAIFLIGICGAVFMMEMRAKKMMDNSMRMHYSPAD